MKDIKNWIIVVLLATLLVKSGIFVASTFTLWYISLVLSTLMVWTIEFKYQEIKERIENERND